MTRSLNYFLLYQNIYKIFPEEVNKLICSYCNNTTDCNILNFELKLYFKNKYQIKNNFNRLKKKMIKRFLLLDILNSRFNLRLQYKDYINNLKLADKYAISTLKLCYIGLKYYPQITNNKEFMRAIKNKIYNDYNKYKNKKKIKILYNLFNNIKD